MRNLRPHLRAGWLCLGLVLVAGCSLDDDAATGAGDPAPEDAAEEARGDDEESLLAASVDSPERVPNQILLHASECTEATREDAVEALREALGPEGVVRIETSPIDPCLTVVEVLGDGADAERDAMLTGLRAVTQRGSLVGKVVASTNVLLQVAAAPNDPRFATQWALENTGQAVDGVTPGTPGQDLRAVSAWDAGARGTGVVVAVLDTGIDLQHPDLAGHVWPGCVADPGQCDLVAGVTPQDAPSLPHGTAVSGVIGAGTDDATGVSGVGWGATIMPLKVCGADGSCTGQDLIEGITFARDRGARIVNLSLGTPTYSAPIASAIAQAPGVLFVAGAGNAGTDQRFYPAALGYENVVAVAAIDHRGQLARFTAASSTNWGSWVDVAAPGYLVVTTVASGGYDWWSGTSLAAPQVSGVAALVLGDQPELTPGQVKARLAATSKPLLAQTLDPHKSIAGGRVDAGAAVGAGATPPSPWAVDQWGASGDIPVPGRYFGGDRLDLGVYRPSDGHWYLKRATGPEMHIVGWGVAEDRPTSGDFLQLGRSQLAQFRPSTGSWYVLDPITGEMAFAQWGTAGDVPVAGDFIGDAAADLGIYRPSTGEVWVRVLATGEHVGIPIGVTGGVPVTGPFGGGRDEVAVFRDGLWTILDAASGATRTLRFGQPGDLPFTIRHFDASRADVAVFRPTTGEVFIRSTASEQWTGTGWGAAGDVPLGADLLGRGADQLVQFRPATGEWWMLDLTAQP